VTATETAPAPAEAPPAEVTHLVTAAKFAKAMAITPGEGPVAQEDMTLADWIRPRQHVRYRDDGGAGTHRHSGHGYRFTGGLPALTDTQRGIVAVLGTMYADPDVSKKQTAIATARAAAADPKYATEMAAATHEGAVVGEHLSRMDTAALLRAASDPKVTQWVRDAAARRAEKLDAATASAPPPASATVTIGGTSPGADGRYTLNRAPGTSTYTNAAPVAPQKPTNPAELAAWEWGNDPDVRASFSSMAVYVAYRKCDMAGLVRRAGNRDDDATAPVPPAIPGHDAKAQAESEWDNRPAVREGWVSRAAYVAYRTSELQGLVRLMKR
jgi:hypothetical protein